MATQLASWALHYSCSLVASLFAVTCFFVNDKPAKKPTKKKRKAIRNKHQVRVQLVLTVLIVLTYVSQIALIIATQDLDRSQPFLMHMTSLAAVWTAVWFRQRQVPKYALAGASSVTAAFEVPLLALSLCHRPTHWVPIAQITISSVRLLLLTFVAAAILLEIRQLWEIRQLKKNTSEESRPFLNRNHTTYGATNGDDLDNSSGSESETDAAKPMTASEKRAKKRDEQLQTFRDWLKYIKSFKIILPYLIPRNDRKVQLCIAVSVACLAVERVLNVAIPQQLANITNSIFSRETPYASLVKWGFLKLLNSESGVGLIQTLVKIPIRQFANRQIKNAAFRHVMSLSMDYHIEKDSAEVMKSIDQGESMQNLLEMLVLDIIPTILDLFIACFIFNMKFGTYTSLLVVLAATAYVSAEVKTSNWNSEKQREKTQAQRDETRIMHQAVQGWQTVTYFNQHSQEKDRFKEAVAKRQKASAIWSRRRAFGRALTETIKPIAYVCLASLIVREVSMKRILPGDFVFFIQYWSLILMPLAWLSAQYRYLVSNLISAESLRDLFQSKPSVTDKKNAVELECGAGRVAFHNVEFAYDPRLKTLNNIDFSIEPGTTVALVGMTGSGKTTILRLLLRLYDVTGGRVEIDGQDIRDVTLGSLRRAIGVVPQDPILFNATVMENLKYARPGASDEEVYEACRAAAIHDKIEKFVDQYNTKVGEQGVKLSGGELQRIAIARVFLTRSPILLLDEATSAVDSTTESEIQVALDRLRAKRTTIVIAHRLSTIVNSDLIIVLHEGQVLESGSHQELLTKKDGSYYKLWHNQFGNNTKI
jgi:ABC-type transport system involved in Fe-S cluster assembly fused permease/ATPase subunit